MTDVREPILQPETGKRRIDSEMWLPAQAIEFIEISKDVS